MKTIRPNTAGIENTIVKRWNEQLYKIFRRNISYGHSVDGQDQNIDGKMLEITDTGVAGTTNTLNHNLGRIPLYIDVKYKSIAGDWQDTGTTWTKNQAFIKFTTDHMHVRLFVH